MCHACATQHLRTTSEDFGLLLFVAADFYSVFAGGRILFGRAKRSRRVGSLSHGSPSMPVGFPIGAARSVRRRTALRGNSFWTLVFLPLASSGGLLARCKCIRVVRRLDQSR